MAENQTDILTDIVTSFQLIRANTGKRFANFLIDYVVYLLLIAGVSLIWILTSPESFGKMNNGNEFGFNLIGLIIYGLYMACMELVTKGRSPGKIITGTKAVNEDGSNIDAGTAFKRGFSRVVPFEILSALGSPCYPWHDKWNHTYVIDIKKSSQLSVLENDYYKPS
ncbi:MAG: RDD family protein [Bacteroidota bacterium]